MKIELKIDNLDQLEQKFQEAPQQVARGIQNALQRSILLIESMAKREAPVNKQSGGGNLRQSIRSQMTNAYTGVVSVGAVYALFVHQGTRPHIIQARDKKVLANVRTGQIFGRTVHHPGTRANPFLQRAVDKARPEINKYFQAVLQGILK
jgi:HK97 gp10 family phage protein